MTDPTTSSAAHAKDVAHLVPDQLVRFVALNAPLERLVADPARRSALASIAPALQASARVGPDCALRDLPGHVGRAMAGFGWLWNGIYVLGPNGELHLGPAHGPPVCSPLERHGGALTSGMCFDALAMNQTLVAHDVTQWPGYVSCDSASGLGTLASIVCPLRDPDGRPFAVWDLDATQPLEDGDVRFMDVLLSSLARCVALTPACL